MSIIRQTTELAKVEFFGEKEKGIEIPSAVWPQRAKLVIKASTRSSAPPVVKGIFVLQTTIVFLSTVAGLR